MKDERIVLGCPFCGTPATDIEWEPLLRTKTSTVVKVYCPTCYAEVKSLNLEEAISKWNRRASTS
jgi:Lar family restriction alleviation protein